MSGLTKLSIIIQFRGDHHTIRRCQSQLICSGCWRDVSSCF